MRMISRILKKLKIFICRGSEQTRRSKDLSIKAYQVASEWNNVEEKNILARHITLPYRFLKGEVHSSMSIYHPATRASFNFPTVEIISVYQWEKKGLYSQGVHLFSLRQKIIYTKICYLVLPKFIIDFHVLK